MRKNRRGKEKTKCTKMTFIPKVMYGRGSLRKECWAEPKHHPRPWLLCRLEWQLPCLMPAARLAAFLCFSCEYSEISHSGCVLTTSHGPSISSSNFCIELWAMAESLPFLSGGNSFVGSVACVQQAGLTSLQFVYLENFVRVTYGKKCLQRRYV